MVKKFMMAAVLLGFAAGPATAGVLLNPIGDPSQFAAPGPGVVWDFNSNAVPAGFSPITGTGYTIQSTTDYAGAMPAYSDGTPFLAVQGNGSATLQSMSDFNSVSWFQGSIDTYNQVSILDTMGNVIQSFTGSQLTDPLLADGNQAINVTNRRLTYQRSSGEASIGGIRFESGANSLETDNVVFAVPEPSTWIFMLIGFGVIGVSMRARRRRTNLVLA